MREKTKFSSFVVSFIEIPEDDGIWSSGFFLLAFLLDFPAQEKQPILVALPLSLQGVLLLHRERAGGGKIRPSTALEEERECLCVKFRQRVYCSIYLFILVSFCSCALLSCQFVNDDSNFLYSPWFPFLFLFLSGVSCLSVCFLSMFFLNHSYFT